MTKSDHIHTTSKGVIVNVWTASERAAKVAHDHYDTIDRIDMCCPYCKADLWGNNLDGERDGDKFNDTYTCDDCDVLVTLITPIAAGEYHNVLLAECEYLIEFSYGNTPSTWDE
jgi:hypothetical protein